MNIIHRHVLFVNIDYVTVGDVRTYSRALLLQQDEDPMEARGTTARCRLRGFLTDPALPTFDLIVPNFDYELIRVPRPSWIPGQDDGEIRHAVLGGSGWRDDIRLSSDVNSSMGVRTIRFPDDAQIELVWDGLVREVAAYWTAPAMPIRHFESADGVRRVLGVTSRDPVRATW